MGRPGSGNRQSESILCPLYIAFTDTELRCASHVPECSVTILRYRRTEDCQKQRTTFCEGCWSRCEHYRSWEHFINWEDDD